MRKFTKLFEDEVGKDSTKGDKNKPWLIILLGGSGTGKGALVSGREAIGEIGDYLDGKTFSKTTLSAKIKDAGKMSHARSVFEPDRILRLAQYKAGLEDYNNIIKSNEDSNLIEVLNKILNHDETEKLKAYILDNVAEKSNKKQENLTVKDFKEIYNHNTESEDNIGYWNSYIGRRYVPEDVPSKIESIEIIDALEEDKIGEGDSRVCFFYQQLRKREMSFTKDKGIKSYAAEKANSEIKEHLQKFKETFDSSDVEIIDGSVIIDSAGEDLVTQPVKDQLEAAKASGFNTMILLLVNGPVQSFLGNTERKLTQAKRGVPSEEIMSFYNILPEKHKEFKSYRAPATDIVSGGPLLDGYKILNQDQITPEELEDILSSICIGDSANRDKGPIKKDRIICSDPNGNCIDKSLFPDYLTQDLQDVVDRVNKETKDLKNVEDPAPNWNVVFQDKAEKKKEMINIWNKVKQAKKVDGKTDDLPLDVIDGASKDADELFRDWLKVVKDNEKEVVVEGLTDEYKVPTNVVKIQDDDKGFELVKSKFSKFIITSKTKKK